MKYDMSAFIENESMPHRYSRDAGRLISFSHTGEGEETGSKLTDIIPSARARLSNVKKG